MDAGIAALLVSLVRMIARYAEVQGVAEENFKGAISEAYAEKKERDPANLPDV